MRNAEEVRSVRCVPERVVLGQSVARRLGELMAKDKPPKENKFLSFAKRHLHTHFKTLTAEAALWRAEALLDDAKAFVELKERCEAAKVEFGYHINSYEIFAYYMVGYVSCLEWHARSRRVDLLVARPDLITEKDVKIDSSALAQMASEKVTVPYLLGASTKVSDMEGYVAIFEKVYEALGIKQSPRNILQVMKVEKPIWLSAQTEPAFDVLQQMFDMRHHLVHEIDMSTIGSYALRSLWTPAEAVSMGTTTVACIKAVEEQITKLAPDDFPNLLDGKDELEKLEKQVTELEDALTGYFEANEESGLSEWLEALEASRKSATHEHEFLFRSQFLQPIRHLNASRSVRVQHLKLRLEYLLILKAESIDQDIL